MINYETEKSKIKLIKKERRKERNSNGNNKEKKGNKKWGVLRTKQRKQIERKKGLKNVWKKQRRKRNKK